GAEFRRGTVPRGSAPARLAQRRILGIGGGSRFWRGVESAAGAASEVIAEGAEAEGDEEEGEGRQREGRGVAHDDRDEQSGEYAEREAECEAERAADVREIASAQLFEHTVSKVADTSLPRIVASWARIGWAANRAGGRGRAGRWVAAPEMG